MKEILQYGENTATDKEFVDCLKQLGIKKGDIVCVHTELFNFGVSLLSKEEFLKCLIDCFFEVIGKEGTLIMPTFSYSFCNSKVYDIKYSKSTMGILTEYFRKLPGVKRTDDPIFSFAVKGMKEEIFLRTVDSCFAENSVYDILQKNNGKIILLGTDKLGFTFTHYVEEVAKVPYRFYKIFSGIMVDENGNSRERSIKYYVRKLDELSVLNIEKQIIILRNDLNFNVVAFANSCIVSINSKEYFGSTLKKLIDNPYVLL